MLDQNTDVPANSQKNAYANKLQESIACVCVLVRWRLV